MTPTQPAAASTPRIGKRINFQLSERAYMELTELSRETHRSMTEIVRLGLTLVKIAIEEQLKGNKLIVTTAKGTPVKEIVLPDS
jgi:hypothetical protein